MGGCIGVSGVCYLISLFKVVELLFYAGKGL